MNKLHIPSDFFTSANNNNNSTANSNNSNNYCINIPKAMPFNCDGWKPRMISRTATVIMLQRAHAQIIPYANDAIGMGYRIYAVDQMRGHCYPTVKVLTVPTWALTGGRIYADWYLAHEISHAFTVGEGHNNKFMRMLQRICPIESIHLELTYKKREALAAGILPVAF